MKQLLADWTGLLDALGEQTAVIVGHDWGAVVPGAGHWLQQERPAEVNAALMGFLKGLPNR
jgi:pimeloyl-ACP methyl ester carboxylesterase